jgi:hypothetical protein
MTECAPIKTDDYVAVEHQSGPSSSTPREYVNFLFGPSIQYGNEGSNKTYQRPTDPPATGKFTYKRRRYDLM